MIPSNEPDGDIMNTPCPKCNNTNLREFEEWANIQGCWTERHDLNDGSSYYECPNTEARWETWQAARERQDKDSLRLQWLLDNHRGDFEIKELIAGNFDTFYIETTREAIDEAMNPPTSEKI
jgi:hypothetical protein